MELFLTIIFITLLFFWILSRLLPFLLAIWVKKKFGVFGDDSAANSNRKQGKEGEVYIDHIETQEKIVDKDVGEYIDFQEEKNRE